jgi:hypothetical protein
MVDETCVEDEQEQSCPAGTWSSTGTYVPGSTTCDTCPINTYSLLEATSCTPCPDNSSSTEGSTSLESCICNDGYSGSAGGPCTLIVIVDGGWCAASSCSVTCGNGTATRVCACPLPSGGGLDCEGESTISCQGGECSVACEAGSYSVTGTYIPGSTICTPCASGTYASETGSISCDSCPSNSSSPISSTSISDCICNDGYSGSPEEDDPCVPIIDGGWCATSSCSVTCGSGTATRVCACPLPSGGGTSCEGESTLSCQVAVCPIPCDEGSYSVNGTYVPGSTTCTPCPSDTYASETGSISCTNCPSHSSSPIGSTTPTDCICNDGYSGSPGGPCILIANGSWCPSSSCSVTCGNGTATRICACPLPSGNGLDCEGESVIICHVAVCPLPCEAGSYSRNGTYVPGSTTCIPCANNTYASQTGATSCRLCPSYSSSPIGSTSIQSCTCISGYGGSPQEGEPCVPTVNGGWCSSSTCSTTCGPGKCWIVSVISIVQCV